LLPPQVTARDPTPLCVLAKERRERLRIPFAEGRGCSAKLIEHGRIMTRALEIGGSVADRGPPEPA